ncbi:MAG: CpsD/CapB family tyrosine-protein kinase [Culicoidibacterales bacterium]
MVEVIKNSKSVASEAYRALRTNIQFSNFDQDMQVITVTSATPSEGKSTTMANLAATFAQAGKKTIIVDADMRKPTLHKRFNLGKMRGLSSVLVGVEKLENCIQPVSGQENLYALVCGPIPPNPAEMLASQKMADFIAYLRTQYDIIIIDAAPVLAVADAQIIAQIADGTVLVAAYNQVKKDQLAEAKKRLDKVNAHILGVVMNKVDMKNQGDYYYYYQK